jgi:hypothetical protein
MSDVDITEKLRGIGWAASVGFPPKEDLLKHAISACHEAANEIESLRFQNTQLKERLTEMSWIISPDRMGQ